MGCAGAGAAHPEAVGEHLFLLVEGGVVSAGLEGAAERLKRARGFAELVLSDPT